MSEKIKVRGTLWPISECVGGGWYRGLGVGTMRMVSTSFKHVT